MAGSPPRASGATCTVSRRRLRHRRVGRGPAWANGRVGMFGASYMGYTQWLTAVARPPHLEVMLPECCTADYWAPSFDSGGTFRLALRLGWTASLIAAMAPEWGIDDPMLDKLREAFLDARMAHGERRPHGRAGHPRSDQGPPRRRLPHPAHQGQPAVARPGHLARRDLPSREPRRLQLAAGNPASHYGALDLPAVHIGGWYDIHLEGTLRNFMGMARQAPTERARRPQHLVIGPWAHWTPQMPVVGDIDFGPDSVIDPTAIRLAWFRRWLQDGDEPGWAPVRVFVMGPNVWRDEQEWPLARTEYTPWYLGAGGRLGPVGAW